MIVVIYNNSIAVQGPKMYNRPFHHIEVNCYKPNLYLHYKKHIKTYVGMGDIISTSLNLQSPIACW